MRNEDIIRKLEVLILKRGSEGFTGGFSINMLKGSLSEKVEEKQYIHLKNN